MQRIGILLIIKQQRLFEYNETAFVPHLTSFSTANADSGRSVQFRTFSTVFAFSGKAFANLQSNFPHFLPP